MAVPKKRKSTSARQFALLKLKQQLKFKKLTSNKKLNVFQKFGKFFKKFINYIKF